MAHDSYLYRDPMLVLQEKQEREVKRTCIRCQHAVERIDPFGEARMICRKGRPYGRRCRQFQEVPALTEEQSDEIEELLTIWYQWSRAYRLPLGAPRVAPYGRDTPPTTGEVHDDSDAVDERINADIASQVETCIDNLPKWQHRAAIGLSMANKHGPAVFRSARMSIEERYQFYAEAKEMLMPMLRKRELMRT